MRSMCWYMYVSVMAILTRSGQGKTADCGMYATQCEFYLEIEHWLPMRLGFNSKVYVSDIDGKLYKYHDSTNTTISPDDVIVADGSDHERVLSVFNKTMPGPTLIVYEGQELIVHIKNRMTSSEISIHWHGIEQRGTPWMDGAAFVTQCPIMPGQTFTYRFMVPKAGTFFYHAHTGMQMGMGLFAPLIVRKKEENPIEEHVMVIQDYNNHMNELDTIMMGTYGTVLEGGQELPWVPKIDGSITSVMKLTSTLINGRGRYFNNSQQVTNSPLSSFTVEYGKQYRFRVINTASILQYIVSVDGHSLTIVAIDGNDIEPYQADRFILHTGERFDFILHANVHGGENFWIRADSLAKFERHPGYGILKYSGAPDEDPITLEAECTSAYPCTVINCPMKSYPGWSCVPVDKLKSPSAVNDPVPQPKTGKLKELFMNVGYSVVDGAVTGHINGVSNVLPTVSALTQPREVTGICDQSDGCGVDKFCKCNKPVTVDFRDVVQINLMNVGFLTVVDHPMHVHGYSFHVMKIGYRQTNESFADLGDNPDVTCNADVQATSLCNNASWSNASWYGGNIPGVDFDKAPRKDTVTVPVGGYAVIRFVADNPGLWYIHCHLELHNSVMGMGFLLNDSFAQIPKPPPGFPECRNFPSPEWTHGKPATNDGPSTSQPITTTVSPTTDQQTDERTYSAAEFWTVFGVLLCVIILQFVIALTCLSRKHSEKSSKM